MSDKCQGCSSRGSCSQDPGNCGIENKNSLLGSLNKIKNVIAVMSGKGGVGKSSSSALIASHLARKGFKVGVLDADITGPSQGKAFGINKPKIAGSEYGMVPAQSKLGIKVISINFFLPAEDDPVIWRGPMLGSVINQFWQEVDWRELDYLIVDLPPGTGDVPLTVMQSLPVSGIVIVSSPQELAVMVVKKAIKMAKKMNLKVLGLIENMSYARCPHCEETIELFGPSQGASVAKECNIDFLGNLGWDQKLNIILDKGQIEDYSNPEVDNIVNKIIEKLSIEK